MTTTWIEPPPRQQRRGCLGKGCVMLVIFILLLAGAFFIGGYVGVRYFVTSTQPKEIPAIQTNEAEQQSVRSRWEGFKEGQRVVPPVTATTNSDGTTAEAAPQTPPAANRIELTGNDINQLIAGSRKLNGKAFVSIENNVARVQVSIPLEKAGLRGRFLNGEFQVRSSPDRNPRNIEIAEVSMGGVSEKVLNTLMGFRSLRDYADQYAREYDITSFAIEGNKAIIENNRRIPGITP